MYSIPGLGRSLGGGHGDPLQYSCLENPLEDKPCRLYSMGPQRGDNVTHSGFAMCYFQMYSKVIQLYTHIHSHTHTHICLCVCVCV